MTAVRVLGSVAILILGAAVSAMVVSLTEASGGAIIYNSDLVQPYMVMHDFLADASSLRSWYLSPANFAFPDCLVAWIFNILHFELSYMPLLYSGIILSLYAAAGGALLNLGSKIGFQGGMLLCFVIEWILTWIASYHFGAFGNNMVGSLASSFIHTGSLALGLSITAIGVGLAFSEKADPRVVVPFLFLSVLGGYSDIIIFPWFLLPMAALWLLVFPNRQRTWWLPVLSLAAAAFGSAVDVLTRHRPPAISTPEFGVSLVTWADTIASAAARQDWTMLATMVLTIAMLIHALNRLRQLRARSLDQRDAVLLSLTAVQLAALATPLVMGAMSDPNNFRYSMPIFLVPYIWLAAVLSGYLNIAVGRVAGWLLGASTIIAAIGFAVPAVNAAATLARPSPTTQCLLDRHITAVISDYWNAKRVIFESDYAISAVQVQPDGSLYRWNINSRWFTQTADGSGPVRPSYILIHGLDPAAIKARFGAPARVENCAAQDIWFYDPPLLPPMD